MDFLLDFEDFSCDVFSLISLRVDQILRTFCGS